MEILTSVRRLYISFKSLVNDFVYSFGRAALLLLVEVQNHTVPVRKRRRIRDNFHNDGLSHLTESFPENTGTVPSSRSRLLSYKTLLTIL